MKKINLYQLSSMLLAVACVAGLALLQGSSGSAAKKNKVYFSKSVKKLEMGSCYTFQVSGVKNDGKTVTWSSSNPKIAKISKKGKVTAVKKGTVIITAVVTKNGKSISQKLKVTKKLAEPEEKENPLQENPEIPVNNIGDIDGKDHTEEKETPYKDKEVENEMIRNLSEETEKIENAAWPAIGFTECTDINNFCYSVFQKALADKEENPVVSPLSAYLALALVAEGAQGETKVQLDSLLGKDMVSTRIHQLTDSLLKVSGSTKLSIADSVWMDDEFEADASWLSNMVSFYDAEIFQTNLCTDAARTGMNNWVSNHTKGLIPSLFNDNLPEEARLVLMNTIYLKAKWSQVFDANSTYQRDFTNKDGKKVKTDFMNEYGINRSYFKTADADGIILPYDDGRLSMIAIRPQGGQTAGELAQGLTEKKISEYLKNAESTYMNLHLPKFTIEHSLSMNDILRQMGLTDAFDENKADFTGLGRSKENENLYISNVLQKVKIQVDEEGTEAAAVTSITMDCATAMPIEETPMELDFNEPFVYVIADTRTPFGESSVPLFLGAVTEFRND